MNTEGVDPVSGQVVPLYHPRRQQWVEHFAWNDDCTLVIGLTQTGRATVKTLHLNKPGLVNLRRILYAVGEHPPPHNPTEFGGLQKWAFVEKRQAEWKGK